jgi:hypothetical protein
MYIDREHFDYRMERLSEKLTGIERDLKSLVYTDQVFDKEEKLLDNQELCLMLNVSKRTLQRYRTESGLPHIKNRQKIYL